MINFPLPRLDKDEQLKEMLIPFCRLSFGDKWNDPLGKHFVACLDAAKIDDLKNIFGDRKAALAIHDPPYNLVAFQKVSADVFTNWSIDWIKNTYELQKDNASLYIWLGADQKNHFEPFAEFILMMKQSGFKSRSFITMRNQRGYGTQHNWMAIRQELLYYTKGEPYFNSSAVYTEIPKVVKGYYKEINGKLTENLERSKSVNIRSGNVWIDIQQVFHLMDENVSGCFAQKPLKAIDRILQVSSSEGDWILDFFAHSGSTLIAAEQLNRHCFTTDIEPVYTEIAIRRLEHFRKTGRLGWQNSNPFTEEKKKSKKIADYLKKRYDLEIPE